MHHDLHSIMYLLILIPPFQCPNRSNLHSIMYLLIPAKTADQQGSRMYLHSIMYLLILNSAKDAGLSKYLFTFHNVSINSNTDYNLDDYNLNLHSIMYLLIRYHYW